MDDLRWSNVKQYFFVVKIDVHALEKKVRNRCSRRTPSTFVIKKKYDI